MFTTFILRFGAFSNTVSISASEMALGILMLMAIYKIFKTKDYSVFKKPYFIFFVSMILAELISTFSGVDPESSAKDLTSFWVLSYLPAIYVIFHGREKLAYLNYLYLGALFSLCMGVYEYLFKGVQRMDGFFSHSLTFGNVYAMISIVAAGIIVFNAYRNKSEFYINLAALWIFTAALILSGSRGPILSFTVAVFLMLSYRYKLKGILAGTIITALLVCSIALIPSVNKRFVETIDNVHVTTSSIGTRIVLWEASSKAIMMRPFFGYGKRNFKSEVSKYIDVPTSSRAHAHNSYIQYTFLHGFVGLFAMLGFLGSIIWEIKRRMHSSPFIKTAMFVAIVFILEGFTENNFTDSEVVIMFCSLVGLMLAPGRSAINLEDDLQEISEPQLS